MMKIKGEMFPASLYKFYMADVLVPQLAFIKEKLECRTNSEVFSKLILHYHAMLKEMDTWLDGESIEDRPSA